MAYDYASVKEVAEKMKRDQEQMARQADQMGTAQCCGQAIGLGQEDNVLGRRPSLREEAEKQVGYHRTQADKNDRAAAFFREHPEFDEFIQMIRSGVIGI